MDWCGRGPVSSRGAVIAGACNSKTHRRSGGLCNRMSLRTRRLLFTAIAPAIWGSTYIVTTQYLPNFSPMTIA
ncbi:hypothetical protein KCP70_09800 [Salmonella enterica subsp. enterica]|nr:hypothetical protein KCP70_09800 [Salmonella enterica subsp. enterica]